MSATAFFALVVALWLSIGAATAVVMARRGHQMFGWALLGAVLGPIAIVLALQAARAEGTPPRLVMIGRPGHGSTAVLVGLDGSREAEASLESAIAMMGPHLGRLTLATVVDHGTWSRPHDPATHENLAAPLERARALCPFAEGIVLTGEPSAELSRFAREQDFDLLVVGARGRGLSKALGSVARRLSHHAGVPVMIGSSLPKQPGARELTTQRAAAR